MKDIFFKYVLPVLFVLSCLVKVYAHFNNDLPKCDSTAVVNTLNKIPRSASGIIRFTNLVERKKSNSDEIRYCKGVAIDTSGTWDENISFKYSIVWKDSKKKQFEIKLHN